MAERKKTTKEERMEIVQYCINHGRNYKETAAKYHGYANMKARGQMA